MSNFVNKVVVNGQGTDILVLGCGVGLALYERWRERLKIWKMIFLLPTRFELFLISDWFKNRFEEFWLASYNLRRVFPGFCQGSLGCAVCLTLWLGRVFTPYVHWKYHIEFLLSHILLLCCVCALLDRRYCESCDYAEWVIFSKCQFWK